MKVTTPLPETDAILARLGAGRFAIDLAEVAEVGRVPVITRIPGVPGWLAGLTNWRGRILPVLDLRSLFGAEAGSPGPGARLVVVASQGVDVGLLVDAVDGTTTLGPDLAPFPSVQSGVGAELVRGQVPREDGPVAVVDVAALVRLRDGLPRGRRSA